MAIENRDVAVGTVLTARYKKQDRTCEVVETQDGLRYRLDDGTEHRSPSAAAKAMMGGISANGWRVWSIAGTEKPRRERKPTAEKPPKAAETKPAKKASAKKKNGAKKPKGKAVRAASRTDSYGCGACGETFPTMKSATQHAMTHTSA